ncbi:hypothetical protein VNO80_34689 [Phaseolus coccineus]|uniref:Uncharacterized protein n=1 Tax=Phaseolus coccineus TaxID=3886 RepID=A0AAN9KR10_PHACN
MRMLLLAGSMPRASNGQTRIPLVATLPWVSEDPKVTHSGPPCPRNHARARRHTWRDSSLGCGACGEPGSLMEWRPVQFSTIGYNPPWMTPDPQCEMGGYSLFDGIYYSDNRSNSRANTCNKPRLLEGTHLLDKRSTQALPVALMIHDNSSDRTALVPATHHSNFCPINFRCWTLGWVDRSASGVHRSGRPFCRRCAPGLNWPGRASGAVTLKKLECSKQAYALDTLAWDNTTGF